MSLENKNGILTGELEAVMAEISKLIGYTLFRDEANFLKNPGLNRVIAGTDRVVRYPTMDGTTTPMVESNQGPRGDGII